MASRRHFIKLGSFCYLLSYGGLQCISSTSLRSASGEIFSPLEGAILQRALFLLLPFDELSEQSYQTVLQALALVCQEDEGNLRLVKGGIRQLMGDNTAADQGAALWLSLPQSQQEASLDRLEGGEFFDLLYRSTFDNLLNNRELWQLIGYEGSSLEHGGYLQRGLSDIDWLGDGEAGLNGEGPDLERGQ